MKPATKALVWSYRRQFLEGFPIPALIVTLAAVGYALIWRTESPHLLVLFCGCGWMIAAGRPAVIEPYHLNLPVSSRELVTISSGIGCGVFVTFYLFMAVTLNWLGNANWLYVGPALWLGGWMLAALAIIQWLHLRGPGAIYFGYCLGAFGFAFHSPTDGGSLGELNRFAQWGLLAIMILGSWRLQIWAIDRQRSGAEPPWQVLDRSIRSVSQLRRENLVRFRDPNHALFSLDWRPTRDAIIVASIAFAFATILVPAYVDITLIGVPIFAYLVFPLLGFFATSEFVEVDQKANGELRWTLPVSDQTIAHQYMKHLVISILVWWLAGLLCIIALVAWLLFTDQFAAAVRPALASLEGGVSQWVVVALACTVGPPTIAWISSTIGLQASIQDGCGSRTQAMIWCLLVLVAFVNQWNPKIATQWAVWQVIGVTAGAMMVAGSARAFQYGVGWNLLCSLRAKRLIVGWALALSVSIIAMVITGLASPGMILLSAGVLSLVFKPLAGVPLAIMTRRHFQ